MRPTEALFEVRKLYRKKSLAKRTLAVLNPLPKDYTHRRGGRVPQRSLSGVYHGAIISTGTNVNTNNKDHTYYSTRRFKPNVKRLVHHSEVLGAGFRMQTTTKALREIKRYGGFDNYLLNVPSHLLSTETTRLRDTIRSSLHAYLDLSRNLHPPSPSTSSSAGQLAIDDASSSDPSTALAALSLSDSSPSATADFVEIELPKGISSRPHALDRIRPRTLREGDRLRAAHRGTSSSSSKTSASQSST